MRQKIDHESQPFQKLQGITTLPTKKKNYIYETLPAPASTLAFK